MLHISAMFTWNQKMTQRIQRNEIQKKNQKLMIKVGRASLENSTVGIYIVGKLWATGLFFLNNNDLKLENIYIYIINTWLEVYQIKITWFR